MPYRIRCDAPGCWHHVTNRGIARRTIFETRADVRKFLALVAREVRRGNIEVHSYCVMATHFHLLVRSPVGRISEAMQRIEGLYARWFNRGRRRDGSLVRGRFRSIPVTSAEHWGACVAYIDRNPVDAHIVALPTDYPYGSAAAYARAAGPRWLTRDRVEALVADRGGLTAFDPARYAEIVMTSWPAETMEWVERALARRSSVDSSLDDLVGAAPGEVRAWMARKARLADGTSARTVVAAISAIDRAVRSAAAERPGWSIVIRRRRRDAWQAMKAGLLRSCSGATLREIGSIERISERSARRRVNWHEEALRTDTAYGDAAIRVLASTLAGESAGNVSGSVPALTSRGR
jgi:REP element-mobilizing transposase RayT